MLQTGLVLQLAIPRIYSVGQYNLKQMMITFQRNTITRHTAAPQSLDLLL